MKTSILSLNRHACWLSIDGSLQLPVRFLSNRGVRSGLHDLLSSGGLARFTSLGSVWVVLLELYWVLVGILESIGLKTSYTSFRIEIAVDKLLLG